LFESFGSTREQLLSLVKLVSGSSSYSASSSTSARLLSPPGPLPLSALCSSLPRGTPFAPSRCAGKWWKRRKEEKTHEEKHGSSTMTPKPAGGIVSVGGREVGVRAFRRAACWRKRERGGGGEQPSSATFQERRGGCCACSAAPERSSGIPQLVRCTV
jgi:hypothetical protein